VITEKPHVQRYYETYRWIYNENDFKINYRVEGPQKGTRILWVHGFVANVNHFRHQFPALAQEGYRVYAIDSLGFGASDKPKDELYSIDLFVELLVDFVQHMSNREKSGSWQETPLWWFVFLGSLCVSAEIDTGSRTFQLQRWHDWLSV
jgi:pimeloyl-ACP methyl ester carboxylesterase